MVKLEIDSKMRQYGGVLYPTYINSLEFPIYRILDYQAAGRTIMRFCLQSLRLANVWLIAPVCAKALMVYQTSRGAPRPSVDHSRLC